MQRYLALTRTYTYSVLFALPLLLAYEVSAALLARTDRSSLRNGADVLLRTLFAAGGIQGTTAFAGVLLAVAAGLVYFERRRKKVPIRSGPFFGMAAESVVYGLLLGAVVGTLTHWMLQGVGFRLSIAEGALAALTMPEAIVLSLGAGIYEELVFRVILVGGLFGVFQAGGLDRRNAGAFAAILAAIIFSAFHYIGPYGDPWAVPTFLFRAIAGLAFSVLFLLRGFGITAWTHALYDIFLFLARGF